AGTRVDEVNAPLRAVLERADHVLYQSEFCKVAADRFLGPPVGGWEVLYNAVDTRKFAPSPEPPAGMPVLLLSGDQSQEYRLRVALQTIALLPDVRLLVTGSLAVDGHALAEQLGVAGRVLFTGRYAQRDAPAVYRRAHVLLHPKV